MIELIPRPYKLFNKIQHYDWGTKDENAFIPKLLGTKAEPGTPYAELWIGAHPKAPSEIEVAGRRIALDEVISRYSLECLGKYVSGKFAGKLPFLLKVLSAAHALSIQTHPNKNQAVRLHAASPDHYPDDNHKPEIAIALDSLRALVGFKPAHRIAESMRAVPELSACVDRRLYDAVVGKSEIGPLESAVKNLYADMMKKSETNEGLSSCVRAIHERLLKKNPRTAEEEEFLRQHELYGDDVGLLSFFFLNLVDLKAGQSIFTAAGVPHAYIKGNIIECMANSDNVVRAGLTGKFKDVDTLLDIVRYEFADCEIINSEQHTGEVVYKSGAEEFEITRLSKEGGFKRVCRPQDRPSIWLVTGGELEVVWSRAGADHLKSFSRGESFFVPAFLSEFSVSSESGVDCFIVGIP